MHPDRTKLIIANALSDYGDVLGPVYGAKTQKKTELVFNALSFMGCLVGAEQSKDKYIVNYSFEHGGNSFGHTVEIAADSAKEAASMALENFPEKDSFTMDVLRKKP